MTTELDENGNPIISKQDDDDYNDDGGDDTIDYKSLLEQERAEKEQALADAKKRKERFKGAKATENKNSTVDQESIKKMVDESVGVVKFYSENKDANQYQQDIEALVAKGIERDRAFRLIIAEKDPSMLLDDAKRAQLNGNTALNGVPQQNGAKDYTKMTDEEIASLPQEEFDRLYPSALSPKKYYSEAPK